MKRINQRKFLKKKKQYGVLNKIKCKIKYIEPQKGERYASALTNMNLNNKVVKKFGKINLKNYINQFLSENNKKIQ